MDRVKFIIDACRRRSVLHLGFCDTPYCRESAEGGRLLHFKIAEVASELWGLDVCAEDIEFLRQRYGLRNLIVGDAESLQTTLGDEKFDVVVAGEILEHLFNPGLCLRSIRAVLRDGGTAIITVPNGLAFRRGLKALLGGETVHPDHNFYFSRKTITRLVESCGFSVAEICGYRLRDRHFLSAYLADRFASMFSQWACEGIMLRAVSVYPRC